MSNVVAIERNGQAGPVTSRLDGGILRLTISNPPANALSMLVLEEMLSAIERAGSNPDVRVVVVASSGKVFSAGHDLKELTARRGDADGGRAFFEDTFLKGAALMEAIVSCPNPVIAAVDGLATAAGLQLVASCDLAIATHESTFCTPGVNIGLFCSTPMVALSRNVSRKQAMEMLLTGETIDAASAREFGLVNRVVPREYLDQVVTKYARTIAEKSPLTLKIGKEAFYRQAEMSLADAYGYAARTMAENMLARDAQEGVSAFLQRRQPVWGRGDDGDLK